MTAPAHAFATVGTRAPRCPVGPVRRSVAALVLALVTGLPLGSAGRLVPDPEDRGPFLGV